MFDYSIVEDIVEWMLRGGGRIFRAIWMTGHMFPIIIVVVKWFDKSIRLVGSEFEEIIVEWEFMERMFIELSWSKGIFWIVKIRLCI